MRRWSAVDNTIRETIASRVLHPAPSHERIDTARKRLARLVTQDFRMRTSPPSKVKLLGVDDVDKRTQTPPYHPRPAADFARRSGEGDGRASRHGVRNCQPFASSLC